MAPPSVKALAARVAPLALFAALLTWTALELAVRTPPAAAAGGAALLVLAVGFEARAVGSLGPAPERAARGLVGIAYFGARLLWAGVDPLPMIAFLILLMALASLQGLGRTFAPVYASMAGDSEVVAKVDAAAAAAYARAIALLAFTFVASLLLALLVPFAIIQSTDLVAATGLALALLIVIAWLALAPSTPSRRG